MAIELAVGFAALLVMTKILGKMTLSQITPFDFIAALVLGELVGNAVYDKDAKIGTILIAIAIWGALIYIIEWTTQKFPGSRKLLEGEPSIIISNGRLNRKQMKKNRIDINQLQVLLRKENVFSVREVAHALLETDGTMSVIKKPEYETPTLSDMKLPQKSISLPVTFIRDGEVDWENLKKAGFNEEWLLKKLDTHRIKNYKDVFYFEWRKEEGEFLETM